RGLTQVMPETGRGIAQNLGMSNFQLDDLYRPYISIRFGAFYLGRRIGDLNGSLYGALAAYNGGLGNARRWAGGNTVADPDRFIEMIDFNETRNYVWSVYTFYGMYRSLYTIP
ncbi:MAG: lytic transglycosylase domain-containing protein, partial [Chloroflexi bacterium]